MAGASKVLWMMVLSQIRLFEISYANQIDKETLVAEWTQSTFSVILSKDSLLNFISNYYDLECLRSNSDLFLKIITEPALSPLSRGRAVERYFSIFTATSLYVEPHRTEVFLKVLDVNLPFYFSDGLEKYYNLFNSTRIKQKMAEKGWHHSIMVDVIGQAYYNYDTPPLTLFAPNIKFNDWFNEIFGKKRILRKIIQEQLIDHDSKSVKWSYFKFLQASSVFNLNYDVLIREITNCLRNNEAEPFLCVNLFSDLQLRGANSPAIQYLKDYYGDKKLLHLLRQIKDSYDFNQVCEIIQDCLNNNYKPSLPKRLRDWSDLIAYTKEEQKKAQQQDFSLEQYGIYDWEGLKILNYTIWVPKRNFKLIRGGTEMHNCVGNGEYSRRIVNKKSFIFFLKKGKKTQVCIELKRDDLAIRSIRGLANNEPPVGVTQAVESFIVSRK